MYSRERYSGSNEDSPDETNCSSDNQSDHREQEYDDVDGASSRPNRSSIFLLKSMIIYVKFYGRSYVSIPLAPCSQFTPDS